MPTLTPSQRYSYYLLEAERTGIHLPLLAALYQVQKQPTLTDGETGLGISPANRVSLEQVNSFPEQVQYAANTLRSLTNSLVGRGWGGSDLWSGETGRYSDRFVQAVAAGYLPPTTETAAARLETCDGNALLQAYLQEITATANQEQLTQNLPQNLGYLDRALLSFTERVADYYSGLPHQRDALLEAARIWRQLDSQAAVMQVLVPNINLDNLDLSQLDLPLKQFIQRLSPNYAGLPHQREALIRLAQLWRELRSREEAIASLQNNTSADPGLKIVDPALIAFVQRLPQFYQGSGSQRNALTEFFRLWRQLDSRNTAISTLGVNPAVLSNPNTDRATLTTVAAQLDRELLEFARRVPANYQEQESQREALIRLVQLWRNLATRDQAIRSLFDDLKRMNDARKDTPEAPPKPVPIIVPSRPARWTLRNIQLSAPIIPNGSFTWAEATHGGTRMPPDQATLDAMIRIARLAQNARDRIGRPFIITSWYRPPAINRAVGGATYSRHMVGDAIDFLCEGLSGNQLYWALDPWWPGGLGRYRRFPNLCHIDARSYRARWLN